MTEKQKERIKQLKEEIKNTLTVKEFIIKEVPTNNINARTKKSSREIRRELINHSIKELKDLIVRLTPLTVAPRKYILQRDNNKCRFCGSDENLCVHHITPKALGGDNHEYNLITLCKLCHIFLHCNPVQRINKSELIKSKMIKIKGNTFSVNGKKWGRKPIRGIKNLDASILKLHKEGKKIREICEEVYYWDGNHHKKFVSLGYVHKLLHKSKDELEDKKQQEVAKLNYIKEPIYENMERLNITRKISNEK